MTKLLFYSLLECFGINLMSYSYFFPLMLDPKDHLIYYGLSHDSIGSTRYGIFGGGGIGESQSLG